MNVIWYSKSEMNTGAWFDKSEYGQYVFMLMRETLTKAYS